MIRALWDVYRVPSKMTFMQKLRLVYILVLLLTPRTLPFEPVYVPYIEEEETIEQTEERISELMEGVKGLKTF